MKNVLLSLPALLLTLAVARAQVIPPPLPPPPPPPPPIPATAAAKATAREEAIRKALDWLKAQQKENGTWSDDRYPALTALPMWCFAQSEHPDKDAIVKKALAFILSCRQEDGGIYRVLPDRGGGHSNYNTAICLAALSALNDPALTPAMLQARRFLAAAQYLGDDSNSGGMGYDAKSDRPYSDLNNTVWAVEAMRLSEKVEDLRPANTAKADLNWEAVRKYLERCQNGQGTGPENEGGFSYRPTESKAGAQTNAQGAVVFRSYGTMTYAGVLSLIYAQVDRSDSRVRSALDWAGKHWTLAENPGLGQEGRYYFYNILAKALSAAGRQELKVAGREEPLDWRRELAAELAKLQKPEGFWVNDAGRWQESDPVLVTAYCVLALQAAK